MDYVNLHGTGTVINDRIETEALKKVFGKKAYGITCSSTKSATGHLLGAAGSVEAALTCLAMRDGFAPPTTNLEEGDPECDLDYTPVKGRSMNIRSAISISSGASRRRQSARSSIFSSRRRVAATLREVVTRSLRSMVGLWTLLRCRYAKSYS